MSAQPQFDLQAFNTLASPSCADYFWSVNSEESLQLAIEWAGQKHLPVHVIGGGSNVILPRHIGGLVLQPSLLGIRIEKQDDTHVWLDVGAGENWHEFVTWCLANHYYGLENLALIPGTVGASPVQNIGAYGIELSDIFDSLRGIDQERIQWRTLTAEQCQFTYRDSVFKNALKNKFIISSVRFRLAKQAMPQYAYPALQDALGSHDTVTAKQVFDAVIKVRQAKLPDPHIVPNAGSFFKNPKVTQAVAERLSKHYPDAKIFPQDNNMFKVAAGWLIDKAGLKGQRVGQLKVHQHQALVLTNPDRCNADEIMAAAASIQNTIKRMFDIELDIEPQRIGPSKIFKLG